MNFSVQLENISVIEILENRTVRNRFGVRQKKINIHTNSRDKNIWHLVRIEVKDKTELLSNVLYRV